MKEANEKKNKPNKKLFIWFCRHFYVSIFYLVVKRIHATDANTVQHRVCNMRVNDVFNLCARAKIKLNISENIQNK